MKKLIMSLAVVLTIIPIPSYAEKSMKEMGLREFVVYVCEGNIKAKLEEAYESRGVSLEVALDTAIFLWEKKNMIEILPRVKKHIRAHLIFVRKHREWPKVVLVAQGEKNCQEGGELFPEWLRETLYKKREEAKKVVGTQ